MEYSLSLSDSSHGPRRDDFAALFAMLETPVDARTTTEGYQSLLSRIETHRFRRDTLNKRD